jgi:hypothetical protein
MWVFENEGDAFKGTVPSTVAFIHMLNVMQERNSGCDQGKGFFSGALTQKVRDTPIKVGPG